MVHVGDMILDNDHNLVEVQEVEVKSQSKRRDRIIIFGIT